MTNEYKNFMHFLSKIAYEFKTVFFESLIIFEL